jgi:hypothetical protein
MLYWYLVLNSRSQHISEHICIILLKLSQNMFLFNSQKYSQYPPSLKYARNVREILG